jgi:hypothetical protein
VFVMRKEIKVSVGSRKRQTEERRVSFSSSRRSASTRAARAHKERERERERDLKAKRKRNAIKNGTFLLSPVFLQLHLTFNLREQSLVQLRDDAMTRRAFRRSKAQIQIFQRRCRRMSFSSQRANTAGGREYRRYGEYGEEKGGEKRVAARRRHCHRRVCV